MSYNCVNARHVQHNFAASYNLCALFISLTISKSVSNSACFSFYRESGFGANLWMVLRPMAIPSKCSCWTLKAWVQQTRSRTTMCEFFHWPSCLHPTSYITASNRLTRPSLMTCHSSSTWPKTSRSRQVAATMMQTQKNMLHISHRSCGSSAISLSNLSMQIKNQSPLKTTLKRLFRIRKVSPRQLIRKIESDGFWKVSSKRETVAQWSAP